MIRNEKAKARERFCLFLAVSYLLSGEWAVQASSSEEAQRATSQSAANNASASGATPPDNGSNNEDDKKYKTPETERSDFDKVKGTKAYRHKESGQIWEKDQLHKDHWEVYKDKSAYEKGRRSFDVWNDGRFKSDL